MLRLLIAAAFLPLAACATPTRDASAPAAQSAEADGEDVVCERIKPHGSNIPQKVCTTRAQRERAARDGSDAAAETQRRALGSCAAGAGCGGG